MSNHIKLCMDDKYLFLTPEQREIHERSRRDVMFMEQDLRKMITKISIMVTSLEHKKTHNVEKDIEFINESIAKAQDRNNRIEFYKKNIEEIYKQNGIK